MMTSVSNSTLATAEACAQTPACGRAKTPAVLVHVGISHKIRVIGIGP